MTHHSIVRSPSCREEVIATLKAAVDMTMTGEEDSGEVVEVVLGVDTHLDAHVAVSLEQLSIRLGELAVPTTADSGLQCGWPLLHS